MFRAKNNNLRLISIFQLMGVQFKLTIQGGVRSVVKLKIFIEFWEIICNAKRLNCLARERKEEKEHQSTRQSHSITRE